MFYSRFRPTSVTGSKNYDGKLENFVDNNKRTYSCLYNQGGWVSFYFSNKILATHVEIISIGDQDGWNQNSPSFEIRVSNNSNEWESVLTSMSNVGLGGPDVSAILPIRVSAPALYYQFNNKGGNICMAEIAFLSAAEPRTVCSMKKIKVLIMAITLVVKT